MLSFLFSNKKTKAEQFVKKEIIRCFWEVKKKRHKTTGLGHWVYPLLTGRQLLGRATWWVPSLHPHVATEEWDLGLGLILTKRQRALGSCAGFSIFVSYSVWLLSSAASRLWQTPGSWIWDFPGWWWLFWAPSMPHKVGHVAVSPVEWLCWPQGTTQCKEPDLMHTSPLLPWMWYHLSPVCVLSVLSDLESRWSLPWVALICLLTLTTEPGHQVNSETPTRTYPPSWPTALVREKKCVLLFKPQSLG